MMNTEFHDWNAAHTYTEIEKINWLLNAIKTLEEKLKLAYDNSNKLYSVIKQQQVKANESSSVALKSHISQLEDKLTRYSLYKNTSEEYERRLQRIFDVVQGRSQ